MKRQGRKSAAQTPAPAKERIKGSSVNKSGSASSSKSAKEINFSESIISTLEKKRDEYNAKHPNSKITLATLKAVFRRGAGAYSSSHRPTITGGAPNSRSAWAFARVNKFLLKKAGNKVKAAYVQDDDLMQRGAILDSSCKTYIDNNESVLKTGYYLNLNEFSSMVDPYGQIPLNLNYTLVTYNSGNQDGLALIDTINPINLQNEIAEILNISINHSQVVVGLYIQMAQKLKSISQIEGDSIIVIDRDNVVCKSEKDDKLRERGALLAPNLQPSNLTYEQWHLVRTPEFKAWFGDWEKDPQNSSKVIDDNGEPLVVYHFSDIDFNIFELKGTSKGFFFVEDKYDDEFSAEGVIKSLDKGIIPRWLQKYRVSEEQIREGIKESKYKVSKSYFLSIKKLNKSIVPNIYWSTPAFENPRILKSKFDNYDGIEFVNEVDEKRIIVAFESNQIKLADGSNTTFDAENPDIRFEEGGLTDSLRMAMGNLKKNGIVLKDKNETITLIAYNTGNQERKPSLYNKSLIYKSVQPIKSANEIIQNFDLEEFEMFSEGKIEEYKKSHLIILNQNEVVYDSSVLAEGGDLGQEITCVNCGWHWNTSDSQDFDKYVCHRCGFDNTTFYDSDPMGMYAKGGLIAPNGKPSNLTHEQWHLVRTPEFKAWFGDWENDPKNASKVVDENGEPLVVYRGWSSNKRLSNVFSYNVNMFGSEGISGRSKNKFGFYFSGNKSVAKAYAKDFAQIYNTDLDLKKSTKERATPIVQEYFLNIRNICNITPTNPKFPTLQNIIEDSKKTYQSWMSFKEIKNLETRLYPTYIGVKSLCKIIGITKKDVQYISSDDDYLLRKYNSVETKEIFSYFINKGDGYDAWFRDKIQENNYDGIVFQEYTHYGAALTAKELREIDKKDDKLESEVRNYPNVYVSFDSNQIKLADGRNTTFDAENPDIRYADGGNLENSVNIALPDSYSSIESLKQILNNQGYDIVPLDKSIGKLAKGMTIEEIAEKHGVPVSELMIELENGINAEMEEHTDDRLFAESIALDHLYENPKYYSLLKNIENMTFEDGGVQEYEHHDYIKMERDEMNDILHSDELRISKMMILKSKHELAAQKEMDAQDPQDTNAWHYIKMMYENAIKQFTSTKVPHEKYVSNGKSLHQIYTYARGGLAYGNSHAKGGIPLRNNGTGTNIEIEGGEGVINKRSMQMKQKMEFEGQKLTPCEIISKINEKGGGVKFKCQDVPDIIKNDGKYK